MRQTKRRYLTAPALLLLTAAACMSRRPVLSTDERSNHLNETVTQRNIDDCMQRGQQYVSTGHHGEPVKTTPTGMGAGAKPSATPGLLRSLFSRPPDPAYAAFVDHCLRERGYEPVGWK
jgi:hypothetical protein